MEKGLVHAAHVDDVFWQVQAIFRANEALAVDGGTLQDWLGHLYVDSVAIALRRQAGVEAAMRLIDEELGQAMRQCGVTRLADITRASLRPLA